jgi:hypothetical protein
MKILKLTFLFVLFLSLFCYATDKNKVKGNGKPEIRKLGTIALDVVEATPFVFNNKLYRLEWVRPDTKYNVKGMSYLHIVDHYTGKEISNFGERYRFPSAYVENNIVYVVGTYENLGWHGTLLTLFTSKDLQTWTSDTIYSASKELHQICNTSLCKTDKGYALMFEISGTPEAGVSFTPRFLTSRDLKKFELTPKECTFGHDRYSAPHCLRFYNGWYYSFYLESNKPTGYEQYLVRSKDLINWQSSPFNPVLSASKEDKYIAGKNLTDEELKIIAGASDINNSDVDFCEYNGKLIFTYSWGNQKSQEFLAGAIYDGSMGQFLEGWFPDNIVSKVIH